MPRLSTLSLNMDGLPAQWEIQGESCARPGMAFHANLSRVFLDDAVGNGKAKAGTARLAFARQSLGGKKGIINTLNVLGCDTRSGIGNGDADTLAIHGCNAQFAAARHGI